MKFLLTFVVIYVILNCCSPILSHPVQADDLISKTVNGLNEKNDDNNNISNDKPTNNSTANSNTDNETKNTLFDLDTVFDSWVQQLLDEWNNCYVGLRGLFTDGGKDEDKHKVVKKQMTETQVANADKTPTKNENQKPVVVNKDDKSDQSNKDKEPAAAQAGSSDDKDKSSIDNIKVEAAQGEDMKKIIENAEKDIENTDIKKQ